MTLLVVVVVFQAMRQTLTRTLAERSRRTRPLITWPPREGNPRSQPKMKVMLAPEVKVTWMLEVKVTRTLEVKVTVTSRAPRAARSVLCILQFTVHLFYHLIITVCTIAKNFSSSSTSFAIQTSVWI